MHMKPFRWLSFATALLITTFEVATLSGASSTALADAPPAEAPGDTAESSQPQPDGTLFVSPRKGQSDEQVAKDRYECDTWAVDQTGYDPAKENGGVSPDIADRKRAEFFRAEADCLVARGYFVK
jgi:hypothetical protein